MLKDTEHTFVVLAYEESPYLRECVKSVTNQTVKSRVMVSTSTPSDYISNIAGEFNLQVHVNDHDPSICDDWNSALKVAETKFVTLAHQDDVYDEQYVKTVVGKMRNSERPIIGFSECGEMTSQKKITNSHNLKIKRLLLKPMERKSLTSSTFWKRRCLSLGSPIPCPAVTYNLDLIHRPLFEKNFKCDLDWEAWEKLSSINGSFVYVKEPLAWHRLHEASETSHLIENGIRSKEDLGMLKKFWPAPIAKLICSQYVKAQKGNAC